MNHQHSLCVFSYPIGKLSPLPIYLSLLLTHPTHVSIICQGLILEDFVFVCFCQLDAS